MPGLMKCFFLPQKNSWNRLPSSVTTLTHACHKQNGRRRTLPRVLCYETFVSAKKLNHLSRAFTHVGYKYENRYIHDTHRWIKILALLNTLMFITSCSVYVIIHVWIDIRVNNVTIIPISQHIISTKLFDPVYVGKGDQFIFVDSNHTLRDPPHAPTHHRCGDRALGQVLAAHIRGRGTLLSWFGYKHQGITPRSASGRKKKPTSNNLWVDFNPTNLVPAYLSWMHNLVD